MSKFSKFKILSVEWKAEDNDGNEETFMFKPLPFELFPDVYDLIGLMSDAGLMSDGLSEDVFIKKLNKSIINKLITVEFEMVKNSYPDMPDEDIKDFVGGNMFSLLEPLMSLLSRGEKASPRQVEKALQNEL